MPSGASCKDDGRTRFALWAPAAGSIELVIEGGDAIPMERDEGGTFTLTTDAPPGTRYRYRVDG